jgi:hypothetical protein
MESHPTTEFGKENKMPPGDTPQNFNANSMEDFFPTCFVEEETPFDATTEMVTPSPNRPERLTEEAINSRHQASAHNGEMEQPPFS